MNAILPIPRLREVIYADIETQRGIVSMLRNLACDFLNCDMRSIIYDGKTVQRVGPDPIPEPLRLRLDLEYIKLACLEHEYWTASRQDTTPARSPIG